MSAPRTPEEIRRSIEANRAELAVAVETLRGEVTKLVKGAIVGTVAGVFALNALFLLLHGASWGAYDLTNNLSEDNFWLGFLIIAILLLVLGGIAGFLAYRFIKKGSPPTPQMAMEEAQLIRQTYSTPESQKR